MFENSTEAIAAFKDFEARCAATRDTQINRIKEDREFLSGNQWDTDDNLLWDAPEKRQRRVINILSNSVNSVQSQYAAYPYKWYSPEDKVDETCDGFLKTGSNARAPYDALGNSIAFGLGYIAIGSETVNGIEIPALYSIDKVENVWMDPEAQEVDGRDAIEAAIVEYRSRNYIQAKYGVEYLPPEGKPAWVNTSDNKNVNMMAIVTYFRVNNGQCEVYSLLGDDYFAEPQVLPIDRPPIFPVYGEKTWEDGKVLYQGLVRKGAPIQKMVNAAFTALAERIAIAPKPTWLCDPRSVEDYEDGYRHFNRTLNPLLFFNPGTKDGKVTFPVPTRLDNRVQYDDITGIISSNLGLLSSITGVDSRGILDSKAELTATEVIYNNKNIQSTIRGYFANLKDSMKACGETILKLLGMGEQHLEVIQGPQEYMALQVARQELASLAAIVPEQDKMKIVNGILMSHNDNPILRHVFGELNSTPTPTPMEQQAIQTVETMKQAILQKDQEIQNLQETIKRYEQGADMQERSLRADFAMEDLKHQHRMEEKALDSELEAGANAGEKIIETQKQQVELKREAVKLDQDRIELAKTMMGA